MFAELTRLDNSLFDEFQRMQRDIDALFGPGVGRPSIRAARPGSFPALNVGQTDDAVYVYLFAPGLNVDSLDVNLHRNVLTVSGERPLPQGEDDNAKNAGYHLRERFSGAFRRAVTLSDDVDPEQVEASYKQGVLSIRVAKREAAKPRQITVNSA